LRNRSAIAGIALLILAVALWRFVQPASTYDLRLTPLTFDTGLTGWPAISPDGRMLAYASDADTGANLEIYIKPVSGGSPVRLTDGADNNSEPAFSPGGATIAFHSTAAGGAIFTVPVTGGAPRIAARGGRAPRYSPDGQWIAYSDPSGAHLMAAKGGDSRPFHPEFRAAQGPAWSPDGGSLLFWSRGDLWVAPLAGGTPESTGVGPRLSKAGLDSGPFADGLWTSHGYLFSARTGFVRNLYLCPLDRKGRTNSDLVRLTNGTELIGDPSVSRDGRVVLSVARERFDIWGVPLDSASGKAKGPAYRITDTLAPTANPDISADGKRLLFGSSRNGFTELWEKDLATGMERVAATGPQGATYGRWLKSGPEILYVRPAGGDEAYLGNRKLAAGVRPWGADSKGTTILLGDTGIDALNLLTMERTQLITPTAGTVLSDASFSADDRWVLFVAASRDSSRVYVASAHGGEWLPVTDVANRASNPRFSPDGNFIYLMQDGEIAAVRFDSQTGRARGGTFPVFRPSFARLSFAVNPQALSIGVARDKLVTILCERTSTIWIGNPVLQ
jgi:Tol biopolymer transport system component